MSSSRSAHVDDVGSKLIQHSTAVRKRILGAKTVCCVLRQCRREIAHRDDIDVLLAFQKAEVLGCDSAGSYYC